MYTAERRGDGTLTVYEATGDAVSFPNNCAELGSLGMAWRILDEGDLMVTVLRPRPPRDEADIEGVKHSPVAAFARGAWRYVTWTP